MTRTMIKENSNASSNHGVIEKMVHGYATQDLEAIMPLFADDAVYRDMAGGGVFGKTLRGKAAITVGKAGRIVHVVLEHRRIGGAENGERRPSS